MANITQTIPALTAGISQQPDEQKIPGQVKDMVNALPDVTQGLLKRPAGKFVASLSDGLNNSTTNGKWFHYYRDENEQYIGQIARNGVIKMWDCLTGSEKTVVNGIGNNTYLTHTGDEDLQTLTLNDFTYINNRTKTVEMDTVTEPDLNFLKECFIELKTISYAKQYALNLFDDTTTQDVTTATRIKVDRIFDSANSCNINGVIYRKDQSGYQENLSYECGQENGDSTKSNNIIMRDPLCPNTSTEIFAGIGSGSTYFDKTEPKSHDSSVDQLDTWSTMGSGAGKKIETGKKYFNFKFFYENVGFTQAANNLVTVTVNNHNLSVNDTILFTHADSSKTTENKTHVITAVTANNFSFQATSSITGGTSTNCDIGHGDIEAYQAVKDQYKNADIEDGNPTSSNPYLYHAPNEANARALTYLQANYTPVTGSENTHFKNANGKVVIRMASSANSDLNFWDPLGPKNNYNTGIRETHTVRVFPGSYTGNGRTVAGNYGIQYTVRNQAVEGRKNLSFRITTTGQSVADESSSSSSNVKYSARYTTTHDLLHGGEGWQVGDHFYVWMANARYKITVEAISTSKVQANLGLIRPLPTSFDTETVVTAESILGDLRTEIIANERFLDTDVRQIGTGIYISQPPNATVTSLELMNAIGNETVQSGDLLLKSNGHGFQTGHRVQYKLTGGSAISGLTPDNYYYVRRQNNNKFRLATSLANANSGTVVQSGALSAGITYTLPSGTHTFETGTFNASTPVGELMNVVAGKVNDVGDLPTQCKHGMVVEVINSVADEDNHYVKFFGNNDRDGEGTWEECAKPGRLIRIKRSTMPVVLIRTADGNFRLTELDGSSYTISGTTYYAPQWDDALVGDDVTNPEPSFIGRNINKLLFFRNRFTVLADENIIMSRPGDFTNFFAKSAIQFIASDPVDIAASSEYPAILYDGIQVNTGLVIFSKNQQFMLTTDSDVFSPQTAKINALSTYNFNFSTNPISLGTTIGFLDNAGKYSRFFEMAQVQREGEPVIIEQSAVVSKLFEKDLKLISNSRENSVIFFSEENTSTLYGYRYFDQINERKLASWFKWTLKGNIQYHCMQDDFLFVVVRNNNKDQLLKIAIKADSNTFTFKENKVHLDHLMEVTTPITSYDSTTNKTTFIQPVGITDVTNLVAFDNGTGNQNGRYAEVKQAPIANINNYLEIEGDWSNQTFLIGYEFTMSIAIPTIYYLTQSGQNWRADTRANTILHRIKFGFGPIGLYKVTVNRLGKAIYEQVFEMTTADSYLASTAALVDDNYLRSVPIYDRNINTSLTLSSTHPAPATIHNLTWEGVYTNNNYTRV